jgi:hypothetical protein
MRHAPVLLGAILVFALNLDAQVNPNYSLPQVSAADSGISPPLLSAPADTPIFTLVTTPVPAVDPDSLARSSGEPQERPSVYGVFPSYNWQIYAGYSFFRFYISSKPNLNENMNGIDFGIVYYPHISWIGVEGQFFLEIGSLYGQNSKFALGAGGPRFRWSAPRGAEIWGHALVGYTHFLPQTALGGQNAFAFQFGGGADLGSRRSRFAVRLEGDVVGTRYFSTYQFSPRFAAGVVYKY